MSEAYKVLSSTEDTIIVSVNEKTSYSLTPGAFALCELAIAGGGDIDEVFMSMSSVTAKSAKVFDPAKAAAAALKVKVNAAIVDFQTALSELSETNAWSAEVNQKTIALENAMANAEIAAVQEMPKLDLNVLRRLEGRLAINDTMVWSYVKRGKDEGTFYVYEIKSTAPPDHAANLALQEARAAFQLACHEETLSLADPILNSELKATAFELDDSGIIVYNAEVKATRTGGGNGGGKKRKVRHIESGTIYDSMTDAGNVYFSEVKYPHVKVREAAKLGKTFEFVD